MLNRKQDATWTSVFWEHMFRKDVEPDIVAHFTLTENHNSPTIVTFLESHTLNLSL